MASVKARVHILPKTGVLDPQGKAVQNALNGLGFPGVVDVRQGKVIYLDLDLADTATAKAEVEAMCRKLLANPVMESFQIEILS